MFRHSICASLVAQIWSDPTSNSSVELVDDLGLRPYEHETCKIFGPQRNGNNAVVPGSQPRGLARTVEVWRCTRILPHSCPTFPKYLSISSSAKRSLRYSMLRNIHGMSSNNEDNHTRAPTVNDFAGRSSGNLTSRSTEL